MAINEIKNNPELYNTILSKIGEDFNLTTNTGWVSGVNKGVPAEINDAGFFNIVFNNSTAQINFNAEKNNDKKNYYLALDPKLNLNPPTIIPTPDNLAQSTIYVNNPFTWREGDYSYPSIIFYIKGNEFDRTSVMSTINNGTTFLFTEFANITPSAPINPAIDSSVNSVIFQDIYGGSNTSFSTGFTFFIRNIVSLYHMNSNILPLEVIIRGHNKPDFISYLPVSDLTFGFYCIDGGNNQWGLI